ncbi:MAG TPA: FAD-dependent oxidoreductase [Usitatibacter sp.]|nr:FAD-dependent oxidoreductase [Usitatibacter sp.]
MKNDFPGGERAVVAVIGAGPIGLAAAAHLLERGFTPAVFEAGRMVAGSYESFRHVQLFSPWRYNVDPVARRMLEATGWQMPPEDELPTAGAMIDLYLAPLAAHWALGSSIRLSHKVTSISREGFDKVKSKGREDAPFVIRCDTPNGEREFTAWAVLDATGTWAKPNPLGANGLPAIGEVENAASIAYGMPDILGRFRERYAGKRVLVAGAGHSAAGNLLALAKLADETPGTQLLWTIRGHNFARIFGGGENDGLAARGALGLRLKRLADEGRMQVHADFRTVAIRRLDGAMTVEGRGPAGELRGIEGVDEVIVATGGRPDLSLSSELRVKLDPWIESTEQLAPLIDPNLHSCGTVRPHGHRELAHPEARFYAVGAKSYGRAPNFLLATGHEQVRSVVAALAGDLVAADDVQLDLPETGVCSTQFDEASSGCCTTGEAVSLAPAVMASPAAEAPKAGGCCGGPPKARVDACCAKDETIKEAGGSGCGSAASKRATEAAAK